MDIAVSKPQTTHHPTHTAHPKTHTAHHKQPIPHTPNLFHRKFINTSACILFTRLQIRRWPIRLVGRIGKLLCLQTYGTSFCIFNSFFTRNGSIQKVSGIYLHTRFRSVNGKFNSRHWIIERGSRTRNISIGI